MSKKILIVDDDEKIVRVISSRLRNAGYDVVVAFDGMQALAMAHNEKPDLIILDYKMPAGNGLAVSQSLHKSNITGIIPIILLTASAKEEAMQKAQEMGIQYFLTKPFSPDDLLEKIKHALMGEQQ